MPNTDKGVEQEVSPIVAGSVKWYNHLRKGSGGSLNTKHSLTQRFTSTYLPKRIKNLCSQRLVQECS